MYAIYYTDDGVYNFCSIPMLVTKTYTRVVSSGHTLSAARKIVRELNTNKDLT